MHTHTVMQNVVRNIANNALGSMEEETMASEQLDLRRMQGELHVNGIAQNPV